MKNVLVLLPLLMILSGCATFKMDYNRSYLDPISSSTLASGKALLLIDQLDYDYVFRGHPKSLHGGGATSVIRLGQIANDTMDEVLAQAFRDGCEKSFGQIPDEDYSAIVQVRVIDFWHAFNQIRNLTMAVTPQVNVSVEVSVLDPDGSRRFSRIYKSGKKNAKTVLDTWSPAETLNRHVHQVVQELLVSALPDITSQAQGTPKVVKSKKASRSDKNDAGQSKREQLEDLKALYDDGLISKEVYEQGQREVLGH